MTNPLQNERRKTLNTIREWKSQEPDLSNNDLVQKIILVFGATRKKAYQYLEDLGFDMRV